MTLQIFLNWQSSVNLKAELLAQELSDRLGPARAAEIRQITINPDDGSISGLEPLAPAVATTALNLRTEPSWFSAAPKAWEIGSNQWVMSGRRSTSGAPLLANDPHLDARTLPGIWHPVGLITPEFRAVGVAGPGIPGIAVGRTSHVTFGVTNAYADVIDLFIESEDPDRPGHYLEGDQSYPFEIIEETLRIRKRPGSSEFREVPLRIRLTHRGPVISDHGMGVADSKLIAMRWSAPEAMQADTGAFALFTAISVDEARTAIGQSTAPYNYVIDGTDAWGGFIPWAQMPGQVNPARGWVGNANHRTVPGDYTTPYSTYFAASWRYRRMRELLDGEQTLDAEDHWAYMRDTKNLMAVRVAPLMSAALKARRVFEDDLGPELTARYLGMYYAWHERLALLVDEPANDWFDDQRTAERESRDELLHLAALDALAELKPLLGEDPARWEWGKVHTVTFFGPLVPGKSAADMLGGGTHPKEGSGETLNRATYKWNKPYEATTIASLRFVANLGDPDKVMGVLTGGASGRQFDPRLKDQTDAWLSGEPRYWWFSDAAIAEHTVSELLLGP